MSKKQAVLLIHGIGEQKPMETLRGFLDSVWTHDSELHKSHSGGHLHWSKPYRVTNSYELRRLTTPANKADIRTDFFELYWAHLMHGNRVTHVVSWLKDLLVRWPGTVPKHLQSAYWVLWGLVVLVAGFSYQGTIAESSLLPKWLSGLFSLLLLPLIVGVIANVVGDAARYLNPSPTNVRRREEIRALGIEVLRELHDPSKGYDRIIVVGHSLGSVIGYDVLNHAWSEFHRSSSTAADKSMDALNHLEELARTEREATTTIPDQIHAAQRKYFEELKTNGSQWRVTDFVTLGSPLAHAEILLARNLRDLRSKQAARELPTSPPELETTQHQPPKRLFSFPTEAEQRVPHHAAVFGPTRWTNLYFPAKGIIFGDLIGGPLAPLFGGGILDVNVATIRWLGFLSHTAYWSRDGKDEHIQILRRALNLADQEQSAGD
ncbi:MAG: hypothetical protein AAF529_02590 [Pseudomonadota bacterium]